MKNIYFGVAFAAILSFSACSEDTEPDKSSSSSNPSSSSSLNLSSSSNQISHPIPACLISAKNLQVSMDFSLCWESATMTQEKCDQIAADYSAWVTGEAVPASCPYSEDHCSSANGSVYRYNNGEMPIPMPCESLLNRL